MRYLPAAALLAGFALVVGVVYLTREADGVPVVAAVDLADPTGDHTGRTVKVDLKGFTRTPTGAAYYPVYPGPATVVVTFAATPPDPLPAFARGVCRGRSDGGPVLVTGARPDRD